MKKKATKKKARKIPLTRVINTSAATIPGGIPHSTSYGMAANKAENSTEHFDIIPKVTKRTLNVYNYGKYHGSVNGYEKGHREGREQAERQFKSEKETMQNKRTEALSHIVDSLARIADAAAHLVGEMGNKI